MVENFSAEGRAAVDVLKDFIRSNIGTEAATITFRAPDGLSDVYTMSGRHISIDVDRLVHVSERDAVPLRQVGCREVEVGNS
jgi:hypothetical protein